MRLKQTIAAIALGVAAMTPSHGAQDTRERVETTLTGGSEPHIPLTVAEQDEIKDFRDGGAILIAIGSATIFLSRRKTGESNPRTIVDESTLPMAQRNTMSMLREYFEGLGVLSDAIEFCKEDDRSGDIVCNLPTGFNISPFLRIDSKGFGSISLALTGESINSNGDDMTDFMDPAILMRCIRNIYTLGAGGNIEHQKAILRSIICLDCAS